jgi:hypothetical protein
MDFNGTFSTPEGERVLKNLSDKCRENVATYVANDTHHTAYFEGMRSVILYIRAILAKDPRKVKQTETISKGN